jgi:hypothetical protein
MVAVNLDKTSKTRASKDIISLDMVDWRAIVVPSDLDSALENAA